LVKEAEGKVGTYYDRFRNRLMFPIRDLAGRTVAFTGRALDPSDLAKYLNSPETELYHKSEILFGMDRAKEAIRTRGFMLLVEGQMDLLHAHQAGFTNTVALSGTAFTPQHAALIKRYADNLMLALDGDAAGLTATAKSALIALREGMQVKVVRLPEGKDPADLIQEDAKEFTKRVGEAKPIVEFFLAVITERERDPHRLVLSAERVVLPLIRAVKSPMEREHFTAVAARTLGLSVDSIRSSLNKISVKTEDPVPFVSSAKAVTRSSREVREDLLRAAAATYPTSALAKRITAEYARIVEAPLSIEGVPESALFEAEQAFGEDPAEEAADELLHAFEEAVIREAYQIEVVNLRRAEVGGDNDSIRSIEAKVAHLGARLA